MSNEKKYDYAFIIEKFEAVIKLAEEGDTEAMELIAQTYAEGEYFPKDCFAAEAWLRKAAELGSDEAYKKLAKLLTESNGVAQDFREAFEINHELMLNCDIDAMAEVGMSYKLGRGIEKNEKKGSYFIQKAVELEMDNMREDLKTSHENQIKSSGTKKKRPKK
jgi:uncharacterized protein